ncbi:MAG: hypothetical protein JNK58_04770 [Phycisphaerae bacterium]|nr:hypothetical protein [Phycisphaerae bacterium]
MRGGRNNLLAGILVVTSIVCAVVITILLAGTLEQLGTRPYRVRFTVAEGATGLEQGSRVLVGGQPVGVVDGLKFDFAEDGRAEAVEVDLSIGHGIRFRKGAVAYLVSPLLGGSGTINFRTTGEGGMIGPDDLIEGRISPPTMLAQAGYGEDQKQQVQNIIRNINDATEKINSFMDDARSIGSDVRAKWPDWSARLDSIVKNTDDTMAKGPGIAASIEERVESVRRIIDLAQEYLTENRQDVRDTITSFKNIGAEGDKFMARLNGELVDKAASFLEDGRSALKNADAAFANAKGLLDEQTPNIRRMMANFRLASDQLTATLGEVRRSPWRLLYRPDKRELDFELLYDSARAYASAVSDLRTASETLHVLATGPAAPNDAARAAEIAEQLDGSFTRYKDAESEFLRQIMLHANQKK